MVGTILEYLAIACFAGLTIINLLQKNWNMAGLNFALVLLYIFLYIQPFNTLK